MTMTSNMERTLAAVLAGGKEGMTLDELAKATGLTYRQVHNTTWRLEGSPKGGKITKLDEWKLMRVNTDGHVVYKRRPAGTSAAAIEKITAQVDFFGKYATRKVKKEVAS